MKMVLKAHWLTGFKVRPATSRIAILALLATVALAVVNEDLFKAAERGDLPEVKRLLTRGADVNIKGVMAEPH
jgi:hypothetical protein